MVTFKLGSGNFGLVFRQSTRVGTWKPLLRARSFRHSDVDNQRAHNALRVGCVRLPYSARVPRFSLIPVVVLQERHLKHHNSLGRAGPSSTSQVFEIFSVFSACTITVSRTEARLARKVVGSRSRSQRIPSDSAQSAPLSNLQPLWLGWFCFPKTDSFPKASNILKTPSSWKFRCLCDHLHRSHPYDSLNISSP